MKKTLSIILALVFTGLFITSCQNNLDSEGYEVKENGMRYKFLKKSDNTRTPQDDEIVSVHLTYGPSKDSIIFDSRQIPVPMEIPIIASDFPGDLYEALRMMHVGDSLALKLNADSVFMKTFRWQKIPEELQGLEFIYFNIGMSDISTREEADERRQAEHMKKIADEQVALNEYMSKNYPDATPTASGLFYIQTQKGSGPKPENGQTVVVNYRGMLLNGAEFDNSYDRGQPFEFPLGQGRVIPGWDEGIALMHKGEKGVLIFPSTLGYGERGAGQDIPPYSSLIFEVELVDIK